MKLGKKILSGVAVTVACATLATVTAFANTATTSQNAGIYGTLKGELVTGQYSVSSKTTVDQNNDNAYLTNWIAITDSSGTTIGGGGILSRVGGEITSSYACSYNFKPAYAVFGTHGVQGGATAYAVYTYSRV